ncbi:MAG: arsenite methyltransferase [Gammaproteobacteria bacterium]|jgi:arsenite methyltransferase
MRESVEQYYGVVLETSSDLKTNACTTAGAPPAHLSRLLRNIHSDITSTYYGCGLVYPAELTGARVLDLGCGSGRDCYVLSQLVGEHGSVVGVDMTDNQLETARRHIDYHTEKFGYAKPNVEFKKGYLETLDELGLEPGSFDVIVSNCVINLATDKPAVLRHAYSLLKEGGEMYFADVYADRRIAPDLATDPVLYGECLSGALYWNDFQNIAKSAGFHDPRLVSDSPISITDPAIASRLGNIGFYSATYRLFKIIDLEPACEDYGQAVMYRGTLDHEPLQFVLDGHHVIERGRTFSVCGNTWKMLHDTRFKKHFDFIGSWDQHFGIFEGCGTNLPFETSLESAPVGSACC